MGGSLCRGGQNECDSKLDRYRTSRTMSTEYSISHATMSFADNLTAGCPPPRKTLSSVDTAGRVTYVSAILLGDSAGTAAGGGSRMGWERKMTSEGRLVVEDRQFAIGGFCRSVPMIGNINNSAILSRRAAASARIS